MPELEELVRMICEKTGQPEQKILEAIEAKQDELSGLISKEGAAHLVALEYGLNLISKKEFKIANLVEDLQSVDLTAKILDITGPRDIEKAGKRYRVLNLILGDGSGIITLALWDNEIELFTRTGLIKGDWIRLSGGYCKKGKQGIELRLGRGRIERGEEQNGIQIALPTERKQISELKEGDFAEIKAGIMQLFTRNPFFHVCGLCGTKLSDGQCPKHGQTEVVRQLVLSGIVDDGSGIIRAVFFRKVAEQLVGPVEQLLPDFTFDGLGKEFVMKGRVKRNDLTGKLELIVSDVQEVDTKTECQRLLMNYLKLAGNN